MKKIYINILLAFSFLILSTSCGEDWLELELKGTLPFASESIDTEEKAFEVLCAAYDFLQLKYTPLNTVPYYGSYILMGDLPSDDAVPVGGGYSDRPEYWEWHHFTTTPENTALLSAWRRNYFGIYRANIVINEIDLQSPAMDQMRAEAKFLRAYFYFELVKAFGNVAFYTENLAPSEYSPTNTDKAIIYEQIQKDLQEAIPYLPSKSSQSSADLSRISKGAAQALLGKAYLFDNKFDEAAEVLGTLVTTGPYDLYPEYDSLFKRSQEFGIESVFEIPYMAYEHGDFWVENGRESEGNIDAQLTGPRETAFPGYYNGGWGFDMIDSSLVDAWDAAGDAVRKYGTGFGPEFFKEVLNVTPENDVNDNGFPDRQENEEWTGWYQKKRTTFIGYNNPNQTREITYDVNERVIRFSDVLLMYAEALNRKSLPDDALALAQVNRVRDRVGLPALSGLSGNTLFEAIKLERRLELAMEGHRFFDLVRWGDAPAVLGSRGFIEGTHEVFPIPEAEIGVTSLVQNNGY